MILDSAGLTIIAGLIYGGLFFLACVGYGYFLSGLLQVRDSISLGVLACIGVAAINVLGGVIALGGLISIPANLLVVSLGIVASIPLLRKRPAHFHSLRQCLWVDQPAGILTRSLRLVSAAIIIVHVFGSILPHWVNFNDDWATYFHFPKLMLETGSLIEPFNFRRMATLGGAAYIQSFLYPIFSTSALAFTDHSIGILMLWLIAYGFLDRGEKDSAENLLGKEIIALLAVMIVATLQRFNHFPFILPMAMFFGFMTIAMRIAHDPNDRSNLILLALTGASVVTYRNNFIAFVSLLSVLTILCAPAIKTLMWKWNAALVFSSLFFLFLSPWLALSYISSGTPFFPVFNGNYALPFVLRAPLETGDISVFVLEILWFANVFLLCALVIFAWNKRNAAILTAILISATASTSVTAYQMTGGTIFDVSRYCQPFLFPSLLMVFGLTVANYYRENKKFTKFSLGASFVLIASLFFSPISKNIYHPLPYINMGRNIEAYLNNSLMLAIPGIDFEGRINWRKSDFPSYVAVQNYLPENAKVISVTAKPYYWNFARHQINTLDCIGIASPPPGQPFFRGPAVMADYFRKLGYRYIVYSSFEDTASFYNATQWQNLLKDKFFIYQQWAPLFLEFFDYMHELENSNALIYKNKDLKVIDLELI